MEASPLHIRQADGAAKTVRVYRELHNWLKENKMKSQLVGINHDYIGIMFEPSEIETIKKWVKDKIGG